MGLFSHRVSKYYLKDTKSKPRTKQNTLSNKPKTELAFSTRYIHNFVTKIESLILYNNLKVKVITNKKLRFCKKKENCCAQEYNFYSIVDNKYNFKSERKKNLDSYCFYPFLVCFSSLFHHRSALTPPICKNTITCKYFKSSPS